MEAKGGAELHISEGEIRLACEEGFSAIQSCKRFCSALNGIWERRGGLVDS